MKNKIKYRIFFATLVTLFVVALLATFYGLLGLAEIISISVLAITAWAIATQAFATDKLAEISYMPSVTFLIKSGTTYQKQHGNDNPSLQQRMDTRRIVINKSKFPINFRFWGYIEVKYRNDTAREMRRVKIGGEWRIYPTSTLDGHDDGSMLYQAVMGRKLQGTDWQLEATNIEFRRELDNIESITATVQISYSLVIRKDLSFELPPETWSFDLQSLQWRDPLGTNDDKIFL